MDGKIARTSAAALVLGLSSITFGSTFTPVIVQGDSLIGGSDAFMLPTQVVLGDDGAVGTIGFTDASENMVSLSLPVLGGYTHYLVDSSSTDDFDNLSLSTPGGATRVTYIRPASDADSAGIYQADFTGSAYSPLGSGELRTSNAVGSPVAYGVNAAGQVIFGTKDNTNTQVANLGAAGASSAYNVTGITEFNETAAVEEYRRQRTVLGDGSGVVVAKNGSNNWSVQNISTSGAPSQRYQDLSIGLDTYAPRRLIGANGDLSVVIGVKGPGATDGAILVKDDNAGSPVVLASGINPGGLTPAVTSDDPIGAMSANGNVAVFIPDTQSLVYYDAGTNTPYTYGGALVDTYGFAGGVVSPMVNSNGWVVFDAISGGNQAFIAWNPVLGQELVAATFGDSFNVGVNGYTIEGFWGNNAVHFDASVLKDGLNDSNQFAFGVTFDGGLQNAVLIAVLPEPASLGVIGLGALLVGRRRRLTT